MTRRPDSTNQAGTMQHFKRVHGDYTLDDPLDPELTMHQHHPGSLGSETTKGKQHKRRRIGAASPEPEETQVVEVLQKSSDASKDEGQSMAGDTKFTSAQDLQEIPSLTQVQGIQHDVPSEVRATLRTLELFIADDTGLFYWNAKKQMLVDARKRPVATTHKRDLGKLVSHIFFILTLVASEVNSENLFKVVPKETLKQVFGTKVETGFVDSKLLGNWNKQRVKKKFIQENTAYAAQRLGSFNLWPPANASNELRTELWKLFFFVEIVELAFGGWDQGVINIAKIVSSPADYLPRQWLWHVFQILMELGWKFNLIVGKAKNLRSAASWIPHRIISIPAQQQSGVARRCLARETWDEVIDNFELDALETWEHPPLDFMTIDCLPAFGGRQTSAKSGYAALESFTTHLREEKQESLPPQVARHFQEYPPKILPFPRGVDGVDDHAVWSSDEDWYSELAASSGNGARIRRRKSATAGQGSLVVEGQPPAPADTSMLSTAPPSFTTKSRSVRLKTASGRSATLIEKPKQRNGVTFYQNHESAQNEETGNGASHDKTAPAGDSPERRSIPGAWDNEWEPEERSFADVSQAAYKWWIG